MDGYKQMIVESNSDDIVYSNFYTGVHGNYLKGSIVNAGMDPDNLPESDPSKMNFGSGEGSNSAKAWRDIWGCGQGIGHVREVVPAAELVARLKREYAEAAQLQATKGVGLDGTLLNASKPVRSGRCDQAGRLGANQRLMAYPKARLPACLTRNHQWACARSSPAVAAERFLATLFAPRVDLRATPRPGTRAGLASSTRWRMCARASST